MKKIILTALCVTLSLTGVRAQSEMYPEHFDLEEVTLLDGPMRTALDININHLLQYDTDRLLTPFVRQSGLSNKRGSAYYGWVNQHPSFSNWGLSDWSLEGHVGGHYLTALALAYAATDDASKKAELKQRLDYMLGVLKDCQDAFNGNTQGMAGFIGGQPINQVWTGLYAGNLDEFKRYGGWVPFYCQHKVLAGLRDAWVYTDSEVARELFRGLADWSVNVVSRLSEAQMQDILGWEHGGMNETLADAYRLLGDSKYLDAAKKYSHQWEINGMQTLNTTFLDGQHANTQVPKFIGFERIYQEEKRDGGGTAAYRAAAHNFWQDVAQNRTVCIGGNSVSEHFLPASRCSEYMTNLDGPESCNSNNMLKLSEDLFDETHDARYADFYESTTWNHMLSTQDPTTGGYVYFTSLRPQSYRIYSQVNQGMWCCVGTGMENHSKYGHFIYTHSQDNTKLYVNLFTASQLKSEHFAVTQHTRFPFAPGTSITIDKAGEFTLAIRHPAWTTEEFSVTVNGVAVNQAVTAGRASYVNISRTWEAGDVVEVSLPMALRYEVCPNYTDYIAFKYGPILLAAQTSATGEGLQNEYGGEGRMDHAPGARATSLPLSSAPLLIGQRNEVLQRIEKNPDEDVLSFTLHVNKGNWTNLELVPFYSIHHARYSCYFYQQTEEVFMQSDMGRQDAIEAALTERTLDFVGTGEQQSEAGHEAKYSSDSGKGNYRGEFYRDTQSGGYIQYTLSNPNGETEGLALMCRFTTADRGRVATIYIDGQKLADITIPGSHKDTNENGFYNEEYPIPAEMMVDSQGNAKDKIVFRIVASGSTPCPGLYYLRLLNNYDDHSYRFVAADWITGDANRVRQDNITYNTETNTITVRASGNNNVCLMLDYGRCDYNVKGEKKYLVVKGKYLSRSNGANYLWWLNGVNKASSVAPTFTGRAADNEIVVAWDLTQTELDANCKGDNWNATIGATIFGLTSTTGTAVISYIGFEASIDEFMEATGLEAKKKPESKGTIYDLSGRRVSVLNSPSEIYIQDGKKIINNK